MPSPTPLQETSLRVLRVLSKEASDGYTLMSRTGLAREELVSALQELDARRLVFIKGQLVPQRVGEAYVAIQPSSQGLAEYFLTSL